MRAGEYSCFLDMYSVIYNNEGLVRALWWLLLLCTSHQARDGAQYPVTLGCFADRLHECSCPILLFPLSIVFTGVTLVNNIIQVTAHHLCPKSSLHPCPARLRPSWFPPAILSPVSISNSGPQFENSGASCLPSASC